MVCWAVSVVVKVLKADKVIVLAGSMLVSTELTVTGDRVKVLR
jgi:CRISPR/Cas system-associated protein Csx1